MSFAVGQLVYLHPFGFGKVHNFRTSIRDEKPVEVIRVELLRAPYGNIVETTADGGLREARWTFYGPVVWPDCDYTEFFLAPAPRPKPTKLPPWTRIALK